MGNSLAIGRLFGIPLRLHYSWFVIFALVTISLSWEYFPANYPRWSDGEYWLLGIATSLLFFASVIGHELAHSVVSTINGVPVRSITLFIFGGVARISREATSPRAELAMALAGPLCSLLLSGIFGLIWFLLRDVSEPLGALGFWLAWINLLLAMFNLIPGFPLDGGRVFRSIIWQVTGNYKKATRIASTTGRGVAYVFIGGGIAIMLFLGDWFGGLWLAFIGWFLNNAASTSYHQAMLREALQGLTARDVMTSNCPSVPPHLTLAQLVRGYAMPGGQRCFLVADESRLEGILTLGNIEAVPQPRWETTTVDKAMTRVDELKMADSREDAVNLLERMYEEDIDQLPVVNEGRVIGIIARDSLVRFIRTRPDPGL